MRKLAWFTGGFAGMCLAGCYVPELLFPILAVLAVLIPTALGLRLAARKDLFHAASLAAAARRALALGLGGVTAAGWFLGWSALLRAPADALAGQECTLSGTVSSYPAETSIGGFSLTVALDGGLTAPDILVYGTQEWGGLVPGDRVTFEARLKASDLMYGDETTYYTAKGIFLTASCGEAPIQAERPVQLSPRWWPAHCARALRDSLLAAYDSTAAPLAVALVTGDKSFLSDALDTYLSRSGTSHAMVVSGLHVSCLVAFAVALTRGRRRLALLIVPFLLFYALMAGGTPSAFRAVMMQGVFLAAPIARRETDGLTSLSAALLVLLLLNPYAAGSVSLQLSFTSVAGILAVAPALSAKWLRAVKALVGRGRFWALAARPLRATALSMATSLGAMAFTQPVLALYFRQASLIFPLTNLLVLWAVALFLVCALPVGLLGVFLPVLARPLGMLTGLLAHYIVAVVSTLGRWRFAAVDTGQFPYLLCLAGVYLFLAAALLLRKQRLRLIVPLGCAGLLLAGALALTRLPAACSRLTVTALDVGQGSSTALLSGWHTCLVDCGGDGPDNAGDVAADYFASLGLIHLDVLVLTHFDEDHVNGVPQLLERMSVDTVAVPRADAASGRLELLLPCLQAEGTELIYVEEITRMELGPSTLTLYPPLGSGTSNEEGLFALCSNGDFDALITGDADAFVEKMLVKYYDVPDLELLVAGHHGSSGSTSEELLDALRPELVLISCGYNSYGHPAPETLERLARREVLTYRTDTMGTVSIYVRGDGYAAQSQG